MRHTYGRDKVVAEGGDEMTDTPVTKDFTKPARKISFKIDDDVFYVKTKIMTIQMLEYADMLASIGETTKTDEIISSMRTMLELILTPASFEVFESRLFGKGDPPIDMMEANEVIRWVMSELGVRPTQESEDSSRMSDNQASGTNLTGSAS